MDDISSGLLLFDAALWLVIFVLHALRIPSSSITAFELKRRVDAGDAEARQIQQREELLPRVRALRRIVEMTLLVLAIALTVIHAGPIAGLLGATLLTLFLDTIAKNDFFSMHADKLFRPNEKKILDLVKNWRWLDWFSMNMGEHRESLVASKAELLSIINSSPGVLSRDELLRLQAGLALDERVVADVMTPVSVVDTVDVNDALGPLVLDDLHKTGHSRFPVIDGDIHHIVGILYLRELVDLKRSKKTVREAMDAHVHFIHEDQTLEHALHGFLRTHRHLFVVVNEYRETVGVLSLEDVVEELLGKKIIDEFDRFDDLRAVAENNPRANNQPKERTDI